MSSLYMSSHERNKSLFTAKPFFRMDRSLSMFFLKNCSIGLVEKFTFKGEHKTYN